MDAVKKVGNSVFPFGQSVGNYAMQICRGERHRVHKSANAVPILTVNDRKVSITDQRYLQDSKSFVGLIGPPGAGKSSLCNTLIYNQHHLEAKIFFEPADSYETFTKGLWMLSPQAKFSFPSDSDWEVLDMEGFQYKSEACWKMAMVLSVLAEVAIFCNRNPRCDVLFEAADVFAKGMNLCKKLNMSPITRQVFIQVPQNVVERPAVLEQVVNRVKETLQAPDIKIIPFFIPDIRDVGMRELPFHPEIVNSVATLIAQFNFDKQGQAAAAKVGQLEALLKAFNSGNFMECDALGQRFFQMDCERIYKFAVADHCEKHAKLAAECRLTSVETNLEEFMNNPDWNINPGFTDSPFFVDKFEPLLQEWYPVETRIVEMPEVYRIYYESQMAALISRLETERLAKEAEEAKKAADDARIIAELEAKDARQQAEKIKRQTEEEERAADEEHKRIEGERQRLQQEANEHKQMAEKAKAEAIAATKKADEEAAAAKKREQEAADLKKKADEAAKLAKAALDAQNVLIFKNKVNAAIEEGKKKLASYISDLEKNRPIFQETFFSNWEYYINKDLPGQFAKAAGIESKVNSDWEPFKTHFESEKVRIRNAWNAQVERAKWRSPVKAVGDMTCEGGHDLADQVHCSIGCDGKLFWVDGPNSIVVCQQCKEVRKIGYALVCRVCHKPSRCAVRPSEYIP